MDNINLYYHKDLIDRRNEVDKYFAIPVKTIETSFILEETQLNIYQEIILELFKCGYKDIKSINEVLNLEVFDSNEESEVEGLTHYIIKELKKFQYIDKDNKITQRGLDILRDNYKEEKQMGKIFYNYSTKDYESFIYIDDMYKKLKSESGFYNEKIVLKNKNTLEINFGTIGKSKNINITFLKDIIDKNHEDEFTIENLIKIISNEIYNIKNFNDMDDDGSLRKGDFSRFLQEKREFLEKIRKFKIYGDITSYILIALIKGELITSINPDKSDDYLRIELSKINEIEETIKDSVKLFTESSIKSKTEIKMNFNSHSKEIIKESDGKLEVVPELVKKLSIFSQLESEKKNITDEFDENKKIEYYGKIIIAIYECLSEVFIYLYDKYCDDIKIDKNIRLKLEILFKNDYQQPKEIVKSFSSINTDGFKYAKVSQKLKELFIYTCFLEDKKRKGLIKEFVKENNDFFEFIQKLTVERNKFSHSSEEQFYKDDLDFEFEIDAKEIMIKFIEYIFNFKFKSTLENVSISEEHQRQYRVEIQNKLDIEFIRYPIGSIRKELSEIYLNYRFYCDLKNASYKRKLIKSISILIELNLQKLRALLSKNIKLDSFLGESEKITLKEIDEKIFKNISCTENQWISDYFSSNDIQRIGIYTDKVKYYKDRFRKGTINTYTTALLFAKDQEKIKNMLENNMDFFKLAFIISSLRGHSGDFVLKEKNNTRKEIEEVEKLVNIVFEIEKKLLELIGDI